MGTHLLSQTERQLRFDGIAFSRDAMPESLSMTGLQGGDQLSASELFRFTAEMLEGGWGGSQ